MIGANLPKNDAWTTSVLTNPEVIAVDQHSKGNRVLLSTTTTVEWLAQSESGSDYYLAIFNLEERAQKVDFAWHEELKQTNYKVRDLWERKDLGAATSVSVTLAPHACALYQLSQ
jgi:catalase (peroxidase I)